MFINQFQFYTLIKQLKCMDFSKKICFFSFESRATERERERDLPSAGSLPKLPQHPGQSQEPVTPSWSHTFVAGPPILMPPSTAFPVTLRGSWFGSRVPGTLKGTLVQDAGVGGGDLTHSAAMQASFCKYAEY